MLVRLLVAAALASGALAAAAQTTLQPGLWEVTNKMQGAPGGAMAEAQAQMRAQMAALPPEQRKMVEEMMAQRGVRMGGPGQGVTTRVCISKEMAERSEMPLHKADCRTTEQQRSGNTLKLAFACSSPASSGEGEVTLDGPRAYSTRMTLRTALNGRPDSMTLEGAGKWMAEDCGSLKPMQ